MLEAAKLTREGRDIPDHVHLVDFTDFFCDDEQCYAAIINILVYRDSNHITATFSKTLAEPMKIKLKQVISLLE